MTDMAVRPATRPASPMTPLDYRVASRSVENADSVTLRLQPLGPAVAPPVPGEFMMLSVRGIGEVAISMSGCPSAQDPMLTHTIRAVGAISAALCAASVGDVLGVRGPYGTGWAIREAVGRDLVIVAGGVGLAPLRPVVHAALADRDSFGRVVVIAGARAQRDFLYDAELSGWSCDPRLEVHCTVDVPIQGWSGETGLVTEPLRKLTLVPGRTAAFLCGPEAMMRSGAEALLAKGVAAKSIQVSLERNMQCGVAWCGHCQLGPLLLCRDGPVVSYDVAGPLLAVEEL